MNEDDEFISVRRLRTTRTSLETSKAQPVEHSMRDEASLGLRLVEELSEKTPSHRARKKIRRGIVWQTAYSVLLTHPEGLAASAQSSNDSEHLMVSSYPMKPSTH
jgi:hypothetical protein